MGTTELIIQLAYLLSAVLFIVGLKRLSSPATARKAGVSVSISLATRDAPRRSKCMTLTASGCNTVWPSLFFAVRQYLGGGTMFLS